MNQLHTLRFDLGQHFAEYLQRFVVRMADGNGLAFFFRSSLTGRTTAFYPSPAGATESELPLDAWDSVVRSAPALSTMADDVEAFLVRRRVPSPETGAATQAVDALIVPIDACYELVGRIKQTWRGMQGGDELWRDVDEFFRQASRLAADMTSQARGTR